MSLLIISLAAKTSEKKIIFSLKSAIEKHFPNLFKRLTRQKAWRLKLLQIIINEKRINSLLIHNQKATPWETIDALFKHEMQPKITQHNFQALKNLHSQPLLLVANHPLGGLDGLALLHTLLPLFSNTQILANPLLQELTPLKNVFLASEVFRQNSISKARSIKKIFHSKKNIIVFPAGKVARKIANKVSDSPWSHRPLQEAILAKKTLVLLNVNAQNSFYFYAVAAFRKFLRISSNLEMLLLPRETINRKNVPIAITVKKIYSPNELKTLTKNNSWKNIAKIFHSICNGK